MYAYKYGRTFNTNHKTSNLNNQDFVQKLDEAEGEASGIPYSISKILNP